MRRPKVQTAVLAYLKRIPFSSAVGVQKGIHKTKGNIYNTLNQLVKKGHVVKKGKVYSLSESYDKATRIIKSINKPTPQPAPNPLIAVYSREIRYIESGIDSLMITKNYLQRRIEQLQLEDKQ